MLVGLRRLAERRAEIHAMRTLQSYVVGRWQAGSGSPATLFNLTPSVISTSPRCCATRDVGGPALRALTFAQRAELLDKLSKAIHAQRDELIELSIANAGTTRSDAKFDIDGATGTLAAYARYGAELGAAKFLFDGAGVQLGRTARFWGEHLPVPRLGAAVHVNAFNFPAWNMLEKAACALLAGSPVIEKPGTPTALVASRIAEIVVASGVLPEGAYQFIAGSLGDLLEHMGPQDGLAFTGSSVTAAKLRGNANVVRHNVRVNLEADSLNAAVLGSEVEVGSDTWNLFVTNVALDITQKTARNAPWCGAFVPARASARCGGTRGGSPRSRSAIRRATAHGRWRARISCATCARGSPSSRCSRSPAARRRGAREGFSSRRRCSSPMTRTRACSTPKRSRPVASPFSYSGEVDQAVALVARRRQPGHERSQRRRPSPQRSASARGRLGGSAATRWPSNRSRLAWCRPR